MPRCKCIIRYRALIAIILLVCLFAHSARSRESKAPQKDLVSWGDWNMIEGSYTFSLESHGKRCKCLFLFSLGKRCWLVHPDVISEEGRAVLCKWPYPSNPLFRLVLAKTFIGAPHGTSREGCAALGKTQLYILGNRPWLALLWGSPHAIPEKIMQRLMIRHAYNGLGTVCILRSLCLFSKVTHARQYIESSNKIDLPFYYYHHNSLNMKFQIILSHYNLNAREMAVLKYMWNGYRGPHFSCS